MIVKTRFHSALEQKVGEEIGKYSEQIANGALKNYEEYKYAAGYIAGLKACLGLCDEVEKESE